MLCNIGFIWNCLQLCSSSISSFASQRNSACSTDLFSLFFLIVCYYSSSNEVLTNLNASEHFVTDFIKMALLSMMCSWVETQSPLPPLSSYYSFTSSMRAHSCCTSTLCPAPPGLFLSMTSTGQPFVSLHANNFMLYRSICGTKLCHSSRRKDPAEEMQPRATWGAQLWSTHSFSLKSQNKTQNI